MFGTGFRPAVTQVPALNNNIPPIAGATVGANVRTGGGRGDPYLLDPICWSGRPLRPTPRVRAGDVSSPPPGRGSRARRAVSYGAAELDGGRGWDGLPVGDVGFVQPFNATVAHPRVVGRLFVDAGVMPPRAVSIESIGNTEAIRHSE